MIVVIVDRCHNARTGKSELIVSHGVDQETGQTHVLPNVHPHELGATMDEELGEYVMPTAPSTPEPKPFPGF